MEELHLSKREQLLVVALAKSLVKIVDEGEQEGKDAEVSPSEERQAKNELESKTAPHAKEADKSRVSSALCGTDGVTASHASNDSELEGDEETAGMMGEPQTERAQQREDEEKREKIMLLKEIHEWPHQRYVTSLAVTRSGRVTSSLQPAAGARGRGECYLSAGVCWLSVGSCSAWRSVLRSSDARPGSYAR